ncbi:MAG: M3 family metallopeptidase [Prevotellaceae bacterium]|jgi:peptidyl-dipeptidase Dcp|nr:M3 family metallopeptidase [Prevotellaceae bacterium]
MKKTSTLILGFALMASSCTFMQNNPFYGKYNTPYEVPPFDEIKTAHYLPAFKEGVRQQAEEIDNIVKNTAAPAFDNVVVAMELSGKLLDRVGSVFFNLYEAESNGEMDKIAETVAPILSKHSDDILLNAQLFAKIKTVYEQRATLNLGVEQKKLLEETYGKFVRGGANLNAEQKAKLREVNEKLSLLTLKFAQNTLAETNGFTLVVDNEADLAGLPQSLIAAAAADAQAAGEDGKWVFTLKNPSVMPFLQYAANRELRKKMLNAYANRADNGNANDNKAVIEEIVSLRVEKANLLGFETYAAYALEKTMAKDAKPVYEMLQKLWAPAIAKARQEAREQQAMINSERGGFALEAADWRYYAEKIKRQSYALDDEQLRPYFRLENVREGIFILMDKLFGLQFFPVDVPVYQEDVVCYAAKDSDGEFLGLIYMDFFPRPGKRSGAWMTNFREQHTENGKRVTPIVSLVCNFTKPAGDTPSLLTPDEVETFFHEFGHGMHSMLSSCTYKSLAGTNVARDFVELPSQVLENWCMEPDLLKLYARHYQTGEAIPAELVGKITRASKYGQGFATVEYLAASWLDMDYHTLKTTAKVDVPLFEKSAMDKLGLIPEILPRYRSTYFNHIFSNEYSAGYYSYIWAEVLDADAFDAFKKTGDIFNPSVARAYRKCILERGGTEDPMALYKRFRGAAPGITPLLVRRGLDKK